MFVSYNKETTLTAGVAHRMTPQIERIDVLLSHKTFMGTVANIISTIIVAISVVLLTAQVYGPWALYLIALSQIPVIWKAYEHFQVSRRFNESEKYQQVLKIEFGWGILEKVTLLLIIAFYIMNPFKPLNLAIILLSIGAFLILVSILIERILVRIDTEHVTSRILAAAHREQLKRRLDGY